MREEMEKIKNPQEELSLTLTKKEWYEIWNEAQLHLDYLGENKESIQKLNKLLIENNIR